MSIKRTLALLTLTLLLLSAVGCSGSNTNDSYPTKAVTMIIPYSPGGTTDLAGRKLAIAMEKSLGQSITVVNQAGASGTIGCKTVLDAPDDGYTVLFTADSLGTQRVMGLSEMSYADFAPILLAVNDPKVIVVGKNSPYTTIEELVSDIKARPGKVKMSYTGPGGSGHVQSLIYNKCGLDMALTAYAGGNECIVAVLGDQVQFTNANLATVTGYLDSGDLRLLAVSGAERLSRYPDVPALPEVLPEAMQYLTTPFTPLSLLVDKDVPAEVQSVLLAAANAAVRTDEWQSYVEDNCLDALYLDYPTPDKAVEFYSSWESSVSWMMYEAGATKYSPEQFDIPKP